MGNICEIIIDYETSKNDPGRTNPFYQMIDEIRTIDILREKSQKSNQLFSLHSIQKQPHRNENDHLKTYFQNPSRNTIYHQQT